MLLLALAIAWKTHLRDAWTVRAVIFKLAGRKTFGEPPGRCIYCNARGERLTDEHIVAYCLAQDTYLLYRLQFLGHRVEPYAALATG